MSAIDPDQPTLVSRSRPLMLVGVMMAMVLQTLDGTIANVALPYMKPSLGATQDTVTWVLTSYVLASAVAMPLSGWLVDRVGLRRLMLTSVILFTLASMLCGAAQTMNEMVLFRVLQGLAGAFLGPLAQTVILDSSSSAERPRMMAIYVQGALLGPIMGPIIGGYLTENYNWRWVFYVNLPLGIPARVILWWLLPSRPRVARQLDIAGALLLGGALVALQLMLDRGQHKDWFESPEIVVELLFACCALWMFGVHSWFVRHPLFKGELVWNVNFMGGLLFMVILGVVNVGLSAVLPTMYQNIYGYDVMDTGLLMAPRGIGVLLTMVVTNRLMHLVDNRILITLGYTICALSLWLMTTWSLEMDWRLIGLCAFVQGLGLGFVFVPVNMVAFSTLPPNYRTDGSTLMTLFRNLGSSFGIAVIVTTLSRNMQTSHADIAGSVTSYNLPAVDPLATAAQLGEYGDAALTVLNDEVTRQAAMVAYLDNFYLMFWMVLAVAPLAFLFKRPQLPSGQRPVEVE